ncbi:MAG: lytic transglycosylase [Burkholderiales bacterium RIFCSPLOWO2_12_FULL_61_40]|nr:MAG: lytic transglycosylase [Burkholderiales bacterium RIFCSPLOWO2_12_FULL_61_40]
MNFLKISCLALTAWLTGCASTTMIGVPSGETPPAEHTGTAVAASAPGDGLALLTSREMRRNVPAASPSANTNTDNTLPLTPISAQQTASRTVVALAPPADLWERIRRGYGMPDLDSDLVHDREQWYASRPDYIFRMTERSKKYLFHVVEELELRNMPTELALLPFIESAFNPQAVSSAKAAGMWQFMPATGKYFELKQNAFRDDRRDVLASTRAALDYLQKLYGMFGDWHLALAAYNWGEGSVGRAVAKNQRAGQPTGYVDLNMPMETRFYVPKLQAVKNIVSSPTAFNSKLPLIENHPYFQSVTIRRDIDLALAAKLAEVPLEDFKALNPSINRPVIMAAGTPQILLPWDNAEIYQNNLEGYSGGRLASWTVWIAPSTMRPAEAAKRVGMSEAELRSVNHIPPKMVIRAGSTLLVPRSARMEQDITSKVADNGQILLTPEVVLKRTVVRAGQGANVASIARKFGVSPDKVAQWNKVGASASFKRGQQVIVFLQPKARSKTRSASAKPKSKGRAVASKNAKKKPVRLANR